MAGHYTGVKDKSLFKEAMMTIKSQNGSFIRPLGKCKITGHIQ